MGKMSRDKGKRGEREVAALMREHGFEARRGQQYQGGDDSPDVVHSIPNLHVEVKFRERVSLYAALEKADLDGPKVPVIFHRQVRKPWLITMEADDFLYLMTKIPLVNEAGDNYSMRPPKKVKEYVKKT